MSNNSFSNPPVVLITGALAGIGRATALAFAHQGANLVISGRNAAAGAELVREISVLGNTVHFLLADVRDEQQVINLVDQTIALFGHLDVLVNNAGTEGQWGPLIDQTVEAYHSMFDTNVLGTLLGIKHGLRVMIPQKSGAIVNLSSTMGSRGAAGASLYVATKHAVEGLTKSAALEAAPHGIRVNAIAPGPVETAMLGRLAGTEDRKAAMASALPAGRLGTPEEIAEAIVFVASEKASFIMGQIIQVNGGKTAS